MVAHAGGDYASTLTVCLGHDQVGYDVVVGVIQVANRFVKQDEFGGLAQCADYRHALLLTDGEFSHWTVNLVRDAQRVKPVANLFLGLVACKAIFQLDIL